MAEEQENPKDLAEGSEFIRSVTAPVTDRFEMSDEEKVRLVKSMVDSSREATKTKRETYKECWKQYSPKHWNADREDHLSNIVVNKTFSTVQTIVPLYGDANPKTFIYPKNQDNIEQAQVLENLKDHLWNVTEMQIKNSQAGLYLALYGTALFKVSWDYDRDDLRVDAISPRNILVDPDALEIEDAQFVIHAYPTSLWNVQRKWGKRVKAETVESEYDEPKDDEGGSGTTEFKSPVMSGEVIGDSTSGTDYFAVGGRDPLAYKRDRVVVYEAWIRDAHSMDENVTDEGVDRAPRYPSGRKIVIAGNKVLEDGPSPYEHGKLPFVKCVNYFREGSFWGTGDVEQLISMQMELDKSRAQIIDHKNMFGEPQWDIPEQTGLTLADLDNRPGGGNVYAGSDGPPKKRDIPGLPSFLSSMPDQIKADMDEISGVADSLQGRGSSEQSGRAIIALQEKALTRMRMKSRNLEHTHQKLTVLLLETAQELYEEQRMVRITGEGDRPAIMQITQEDFNIDFGVEIESGSTLPRNPEAVQEAIMQLTQMGLDPQFALELLAPTLRLPRLDRYLEEQRQAPPMPEEGAPPPEGGGGMPPEQPMEPGAMSPTEMQMQEQAAMQGGVM